MRASLRLLLITALVGLAACDGAEKPRAPEPKPAPAVAPVVAPKPADGLLPLTRILAIAQARTPGEVIDVELDDGDDDDPPTYEVKILTPEGRSIETKIHARTGAILDLEED